MTPLSTGRSRHRAGGRFFHALAAAVLCAAAPGAAGGAAAAPPDAESILERAEAFRSPELDYAVEMTLRSVWPGSSWGEREAAYTLIASGKDQSFVLMRKPEQFYPGLLLIDRGVYWLLLPRSERAFQMSPRHVLNGDVSNADLARGNLLVSYAPTLDGEETVRGEPCFRLELVRRHAGALYPRIVAWITKDGSRPRKFRYHGQTGEPLKSAYYEDWRKGPLGLRSMRIEIESHVREGETTTLIFSDLRPIDTSRFEFTTAGQAALRNAARRHRDLHGGQARPEELWQLLQP